MSDEHSYPSALPLVSDKPVFALSESILIGADVNTVFDGIVGFDKYPEWNPFVRSMKMVTEKQEDLPPDHILDIGTHLLMKVHIPPSNPKETAAFEAVTHVDRDAHKVAWRNIDYPKMMLMSERWQVASEVDVEVESGESAEEEGARAKVLGKRTLYETRSVFYGPMAYVVKTMYGKALVESFRAQAEGLKKFCEGESSGAQ